MSFFFILIRCLHFKGQKSCHKIEFNFQIDEIESRQRRKKTAARTCVFVHIFSGLLCMRSLMSFVNLIRRRRFFLITANHYSVGLLNKQDNKIKQQQSKGTIHIKHTQNRYTYTQTRYKYRNAQI